jgi:hypothetical protein
MPRVTVVTGGHLSTCPRMLKAADALYDAGHRVRVISTVSTPWAAKADAVFQSRPWQWEQIDYTRQGSASRWLVSGARSRAALAIARRSNGHTPPAVAARAIGRAHDELLDAILRNPGDLIYGGTRGAIAAIVEASRSSGVPCGVDFEDFHCGEDEPAGDGAVRNALSAGIMRDAVAHAAFVTAGSAAIADACETAFARRPIPIDNVFTLPGAPVRTTTHGAPRLYWFSQTIGPGRGIEEVIEAAGRADVPAELHLRGVADQDYAAALERRAWLNARRLSVRIHAPAPPNQMVALCEAYDAGLSVEHDRVPNRGLCLPNKALVYPLAGLALILTTTAGQSPLVADTHGHAVTYRPGDVDALADGMTRLCDPFWRRQAQDAAWEAARTRWHWDHPLEREALVAAVERAL